MQGLILSHDDMFSVRETGNYPIGGRLWIIDPQNSAQDYLEPDQLLSVGTSLQAHTSRGSKTTREPHVNPGTVSLVYTIFGHECCTEPAIICTPKVCLPNPQYL